MTQATLKNFSYTKGSDLIEVHAIVEDAVQVSPATLYDPPEFASGYCVTTILWDEEVTPENAPTHSDIKKRLPWIPSEDWTYVPPIEFPDDV